MTVTPAAVRPDSCERAPADAFTAVFERLPLTTMPWQRPGAEVGGAEADELAVGIDLVVVARRVGLRRSRVPRRTPTSITPTADGRRSRSSRSGSARAGARSTEARSRCGRRSRRRAGRDRTGARPRCRTRPRRATRERPARTAAAPGRSRTRRRRPRACATACRRGGGGSPTACSKKSPSPFSKPNTFGQLPDDDRQRQPDDEALHHRLGDEVGEEPEPEQPGEQREHTGREREHRGERRRSCPARRSSRSATAAADSAAVAAPGPMTRCFDEPNAA